MSDPERFEAFRRLCRHGQWSLIDLVRARASAEYLPVYERIYAVEMCGEVETLLPVAVERQVTVTDIPPVKRKRGRPPKVRA